MNKQAIVPKQKPLRYTEALEILNSMHFGARVVRTGRRRGVKKLWWTTLNGNNTGASFLRETTWECVIDYARQKLPVWDKAMMFELGDAIEFDWQGRTKATVVAIDSSIDHYTLESPVFEKGWYGHRRDFGNYDLKFYRNAVKVGELEF